MADYLALSTSKFISPQLRELSEILSETVANGAASKDTVKTYRNQIQHFLKWCMRVGCQPLAATPRQIRQYRSYLVGKELKVATIALKLRVVKRLYDAAVEQGLMEKNPASSVKAPLRRKQIDSSQNYLSIDEAKKLISYLPTDDSLSGLRDRLLVALMLICGARQIELYRLTYSDIVVREGLKGLKLVGKRNERIVILNPDVAELLDRYLEARRAAGHQLKKESPIFVSLAKNYYGQPLSRRAIYRIGNDYLKLAKLKQKQDRDLTPYAYRHTAAHVLTLLGKPLRVIQDFLGHADPRTTAIYAHVASLWHNNPALSMGLVV